MAIGPGVIKLSAYERAVFTSKGSGGGDFRDAGKQGAQTDEYWVPWTSTL